MSRRPGSDSPLTAWLFIDSVSSLDFNHRVFAAELARRGVSVHLGLLNSVALLDSDVWVQGVTWDGEGTVDPESLSWEPVQSPDVGWMMNQPHESVSRCVWQILWRLNQHCFFVNDIAGLFFLNSKTNLSMLDSRRNSAGLFVANDYQVLKGAIARRSDSTWILKPPNSGAGADVFILRPRSDNFDALLQSVTGNADAILELNARALQGFVGRYAAAQEYVPAAAREVTRVLVAGGEVITSYGRRPRSGEHRTNYTHGGELVTGRKLTADEIEVCNLASVNLQNYGIRFAGLDIAGDSLLEVNLLNPGGICNAAEAAQGTLTSRVVDILFESYRNWRGNDAV